MDTALGTIIVSLAIMSFFAVSMQVIAYFTTHSHAKRN